jgi:hypothetical protein
MTQVRVFCFILGVLLIGGCGNQESTSDVTPKTTASDVKEEVQEAADTVGQFTETKMAEYQQSLESKLDAIDKKHEELEAKVKEAGKNAKTGLNATLADLKSKKEAVKNKLDKLGTSTGNAWEEMGAGVEKAMEELGEGYEQALQEFSN